MKWSQAVCASILIDGLYPLSPPARSHPRLDQDFPGSPGESAFTPNALAADWRLSPQAGQNLDPESREIYGLAKQRPPVHWD